MPAAIYALAQSTRSRAPQERCDGCGILLPPQHGHTFEPALRRLRCTCDSCDKLNEDIHKRVPRGAVALPDFQMSDADWDAMRIPIGLAFFSFHSNAGRIVANYPGPAGAAESLLSLDAWEEIAAANPVLGQMQADVEALLVNRIGLARNYYLAPIDECYRLVGLIRMHWRGLGGGALVWGEISRFFAELRLRGEKCPV